MQVKTVEEWDLKRKGDQNVVPKTTLKQSVEHVVKIGGKSKTERNNCQNHQSLATSESRLISYITLPMSVFKLWRKSYCII